MLTAAVLLATAFAAGLTGAWSPCGFSMVETLGAAAPRLGARVVRLASATFALGALAGGVLTFTTLGALGAVLGGGGHGLALAAAVAIALLAALGEAIGVRVVPQIRRQVPEPWRRTMPLPLAAGLYGVLLGLGFTTFVLTLAVWALAGISVAIGSPLAGALIGLGFGAGRALPVVVMAPRYATLGERLEIRMAEQPALLRRLRLADAALLAALAAALLTAGSASAAVLLVSAHGTDPSLARGALAWEGPGEVAYLAHAGITSYHAQNFAVGGPYFASRVGDAITVRRVADGSVVGVVTAPGATQLALSRRWLVWRATHDGRDRLLAAPLPALARQRLLARFDARSQLGRPSLSGDRLAYAVATSHGSRIVVRGIAHGRPRTVLTSVLSVISQPALRGDRLLYVEATYCDQRLRIMRLHGHGGGRTLLRIGSTAQRDDGHDPGYTTQGSEPSACPGRPVRRTDAVLWTTALGPGFAYVTLLHPSGSTRIVKVRA